MKVKELIKRLKGINEDFEVKFYQPLPNLMSVSIDKVGSDKHGRCILETYF